MEIIKQLTNLFRLQNSAQRSSVEYPASLFLRASSQSLLYALPVLTHHIL